MDALADAEPVRAGETIRIRTTGGGGWGDPLVRSPDSVLRDVRWGKVSIDAARDSYGVVIIDGAEPSVDLAGTTQQRAVLRAARQSDPPFFDRGPGYARLSGGASASPYDWR